ncbi:MAG: protein kinase domain-containing protein [Limisphaerales bacterium]
MKNVILAEPATIALFGLGFLLLLLLGATFFLVFHFTRKSRKPAPLPAPAVVPATEIIPRKCPQCGAELKPDVSEGLCPSCLLQRGIATEGGAPPGTPPFVPPTIPDLARLFPQLEIIELIGKGGMGAVYKARQPALDRFVALKILAPRPGGDLDFASRFTREARALAKLSHPNIVAVYDFGQVGSRRREEADPAKVQPQPPPPVGGHEEGTLSYFIMEYVDGPNLRQVEQAGKLPPREALAIIPQICAALQFAHDEGIVHRDIKPENILLDKKGRVKIADFGLAKILGQEPKDFRLTGARDIMGTPHYMAPEQVEKPQTVDHRADIYSLGVVFYEMLTGELPLGKFQPPSQKVQVDVRLDEVVLRSLAKEPELRYQNVSEVKTRVETIASTDAPAAAPTISTDELLARDYVLNIRNCLRRGWALVRNDFWPLVGMSAFVLVVLSAASSFEVVWTTGNSSGNPSGKTSILGLLLSGPLMGGLYLYFLKKIRRETAGLETAFTGFRQPFPHLVIGGFLASLLTVLGFVCLILPGVYLFVAWIFTFPLIVDRRLDFWPAMRLSRKIISKHWWKFLGFLIVLGLINLAGLIACGAGLFITFPVTFAALTYAYEDITGAGKCPPGASSPIRPIAPTTPPPAQKPDRFWRFIVIVFVVIPTLGLLSSLAIQNFIKARRPAIPKETNAPAVSAAVQSAADSAQTVAGLPPVVVETQPVAGARDVEPGETEIRVRFSKEMADGGWSWSTAWENSTPETVGQIHYETDQRTCVLKAKLEPGRTYAWWLNSEKFKNFTDQAGRPAVPYLLIFQTKPRPALAPENRPTDTNTPRPRVVSVFPAQGATNVDVMQELRVRFDQPMDPENWHLSWQSGGFLSKGQPRYEPERNEFVLPVRLLPGQTNALEINWPDSTAFGFHNPDHVSAHEHNWHFTTQPLVAKPGAPKPNAVRISPAAGEILPVLTLLEIKFDQPMLSPDQSPPWLRQAGSAFELPTLIPWFDYDPSAHCFTVPVLLPPDNDTKLVLEGFRSADGILADPVVVRCQIGTNSYSRQQMDGIAAAAKDPRIEQLLSSMKAARTRLTSGIETVQQLSLSSGEESFWDYLWRHSATFKWQGTNQAYADITGPMEMTKRFILGSDGTTCWLYSEDDHNGRRLDSSPAAQVPDIDISIADPFALSRDTVTMAIAKNRLIYEGQTQLDGRACHRVTSWMVRQSERQSDRTSATRLEWWIDAETFLPVQLVQCSQHYQETLKFHYEQLNQPLPDTAFQPPTGAATDAKPALFKQAPAPDEKRFLTIKDGCDGRMSGRLGWSGPGGTTSSGLN